MPLQIIGAGFGRNGTMSLKTALEELGHNPCYHMVEAVKTHPEHIPTWAALHNGTTDPDTFDWEVLFGEYSAAVDWPACTHWESQMKYYPDAKVILSVRDPEAWYKSISQTVFKLLPGNSPWYGRLTTYMDPFRKTILFVDGIMNGCFHNRTKIGDRKNREYVICCYNEHNERVKAIVPKDRLLVFQVSEGWGPLCKFLGVPIPKTPFPKVNDTKEFQENIRKMRRVQRISFLGLSAAVGIGLYGTVLMFPKLNSSFRKGIDSLLNLFRRSTTKSERLLTV